MDAHADDRDAIGGRGHRSSAGAEGVGQRAVRTGRRDEHELHRHPDAQPLRIGLGQPRLHAHLARQLDVADAVGLEVRRPRRRTAATSARSTGPSRSTACRAGRGAAPRRRPTCTPRRSPGAGTRRRRSAGSASRSSSGASARAGDQPVGDGPAQLSRHRPARRSRRRSPATARPCSAPSARRRRAGRRRGTSRSARRRRVRVSPSANSTSPSRPAEQHVVRPAAHVAGVDEAAQLLAPAGELAALPVVARGPLDREARRPPRRASSEECGSGPSRAAK